MMSLTDKLQQKHQILDIQYNAYEAPESLKKRVIPYKKLVVPTRMRSVYWKYFGFPAADDGSIITKDKVVCILCKNQMINNHNTTNLRMHLTSRHKNIMAQIDPNAPIPAPKSKKQKTAKAKTKEVCEEPNEQDISNIAIIFPNDVVEYDQKEAESSEMTETIVNFIISDLVSPDVVDGRGFHCLMSNLTNKAVVIPNEKKLVSDILPTMFSSCKEQLYSSMRLNAIHNVSLSVEEWRCVDSASCVSVYVHYSHNSEAVLNTRLLTTVSCTGHETVEHWTGVLDRLLQEWLIDVNYVTAVIVSFENDSLLKAIQAKNLVTVPCFVFVVQQICSEFCFRQIEPALEKCRKLVKYLQDNRTEFPEPVVSPDNQEEDECYYNLSIDRRDVWLTTFFMLKSLACKRTAIEEAALNLDLEFHVVPSKEEWKSVDEVIALLEPLKTVVVTLFEEKHPLISLLKPLVWKVNSSQFEPSDQDSKLTRHAKHHIRQSLSTAYGEANAAVTQIATILDPRFKHFVHQEGEMDVEATLTKLLTNYVKAEGSSPSGTAAAATATAERAPKSRVSGINSLLGNICALTPVMSIEDRIKAEIAHYQTERGASLEECPLDWWHHASNKCPNLSRLAYRYHCVPAVVTRAGNHSLLESMKFHQKRSALQADTADAILFLHSNKNAL